MLFRPPRWLHRTYVVCQPAAGAGCGVRDSPTVRFATPGRGIVAGAAGDGRTMIENRREMARGWRARGSPANSDAPQAPPICRRNGVFTIITRHAAPERNGPRVGRLNHDRRYRKYFGKDRVRRVNLSGENAFKGLTAVGATAVDLLAGIEQARFHCGGGRLMARRREPDRESRRGSAARCNPEMTS